MFSRALLDRADQEAVTPQEREDVAAWMRHQPGLTTACLLGPGGPIAGMRWTVDFPEDFDFCAAVYAELGVRAPDVSAAELAALCLRRPDLVAINAQHADPQRVKPSETAAVLTSPMTLRAAA